MPDPTTAMIGAGTGAVAQLIGGQQQASAANKAAKAEANAAADQLAFSREMWQTQQAQTAPFLNARDIATAQYMAEIGLPPIQALMPGQQAQAIAPAAAPVAQPVTPAAQPAGQRYTQVASGVWRDNLTGEIRQSGAPPGMGQIMPVSQPAQPVQQPVAAPVASPVAAPQYFTPTVSNELTAADKWAIDEGIKSAQMASGGQLGGRELRALLERGQGIATQSRESRLNRLANLAGFTADIAQSGQSLAQGTSGNILNAMGNLGAARSSGYINRSNALSGTLQGLGQLAMFGAGQGMFGTNPGMGSPGLSLGAMPLHLPTNPYTRGY